MYATLTRDVVFITVLGLTVQQSCTSADRKDVHDPGITIAVP